MRVGTPQHRELFCQTIIAGHRANDPHALLWPDPFSDGVRPMARGAGHNAGTMVTAFGAPFDDRVIRAAVALAAAEETRHGTIMTEPIEPNRLATGDLAVARANADEQRFISSGSAACADFRRATSVFRPARRRAMLPAPPLNILANVVTEAGAGCDPRQTTGLAAAGAKDIVKGIRG